MTEEWITPIRTLEVAAELGLDVPGDLSVIGFDGGAPLGHTVAGGTPTVLRSQSSCRATWCA